MLIFTYQSIVKNVYLSHLLTDNTEILIEKKTFNHIKLFLL